MARRADRRRTLIILFRSGLREMLDELVSRLHAAGYAGIRPSHSQVMENIDRDGTRLTVLAARAGMSHPAMLDLVRALEQLGYVERVDDPTDARARLVRMTARGRAMQRTALTELAKIEGEWLDRLAADGAQALVCHLSTAIPASGTIPATRTTSTA